MEFTTRLHTDLTSQEISHEIRKLAMSDGEHGDYIGNFDCLIMCIGSHGNSTRFLGHDCNNVDIAAVLAALSSQECVRFAELPKLFFVNASRTTFDSKILINMIKHEFVKFYTCYQNFLLLYLTQNEIIQKI